jgi:hypothetical protein
MMPMNEIRIGELGEILTGSEAGRFVEVVDDAENTGGYLIVTYADSERAPDVYDAWVESVVDVELYFEDAGWEVRWVECR